jgi:hypothetical protein
MPLQTRLEHFSRTKCAPGIASHAIEKCSRLVPYSALRFFKAGDVLLDIVEGSDVHWGEFALRCVPANHK